MKHRTFAFHIITSLAILLGLAGAGRAQLTVAGPETETARAVGAWYAQALPPCFAARDAVTLYPLGDRDMDAYLKSVGLGSGTSYAGDKGGGVIDGLFAKDRMRISLRVSAAGDFDRQTLTHEYGHYVWFFLLSKAERRQYRGVYDRQSRAWHLVSDYAATGLEEGFAEAFAFYLNQPGVLQQRDPASYAFLADWAARHAPAATSGDDARGMGAPEIARSAPFLSEMGALVPASLPAPALLPRV